MPSKQESLETLNIDEPRYDQSTYFGRARHFFAVTNPLNILYSNATLEHSRRIIAGFKDKTLEQPVTVNELWKQKYIYDSAFHPDTGEKVFLPGRMSCQVPANVMITGCMMTFYKTNSAILFWQWANQSFNALVNYSNRSGDAPISATLLGTSYVLATAGAVATGISLNNVAKRMAPIVGRIVPFIAVVAANCINIPLMRSSELLNGTPVFDEHGMRMGNSKNAARSGIAQVVFSRIVMAAPGMLLSPFIMQHYENKGLFKRKPWAQLPLQLATIAFFLIFATPLACAAFKQKAEIPFHRLEQPLQDDIRKKVGDEVPARLFYNKGL